MSKTVPTVDAFIDGFTAKPDMIRGQPNYENLTKLKECIIANASQVPCVLGGGRYGYLGALLTPAQYATIPHTIPFMQPVFPGNSLGGGLNGTAHEINDQLRAHQEALRQWTEYDNIMQALRKQIIESVEEKYIKVLKNRHTRSYNAVTPLEMLQHLFDKYGKISAEAILANDEKLKEPWDGAEPFEDIIERVEECMDFATSAAREYTNEQVLDRVYEIVAKTGLYHDDLKVWNKKAAADKTWENFKDFVLEAQENNRELQRNTKQAGYGLATEQFEFLANYVLAQAAKENENANAANIAKATSGSTVDERMYNALLKRMEAIEEKLTTMCKPAGPARPKPTTKQDNGFYCWTHGYLVAKNHTSATCRSKAEGHKDEATRENNMGGSQNGKPKA
jgi:hypothetical protein